MNTSVLLVLEMLCINLKAFEGEFHDQDDENGHTCKSLRLRFWDVCGSFVYMGMISCIGSQSLGYRK